VSDDSRSRRMSPSCWSCCAEPKIVAAQRLSVGIVRKGNNGRKTGIAFRAMPNVTRAVVAPILGSHRRNQVSTALNTTHQHGTLTVPQNPQRLSASNHVKTKDNLRPLNQWIGCAPRRLSCSEKTRRDGSRRISPSCRNCCVGLSGPVLNCPKRAIIHSIHGREEASWHDLSSRCRQR